MKLKVAAIVVSHNSASCLSRCIHDLAGQDYPIDAIVVVDSGSTNTEYLSDLAVHYPIHLYLRENIGFGCGNNLGLSKISKDTDFVVFVNPDVFLPADFVTRALQICEHFPEADIVSGKLLGYDPDRDCPTSRLDSTGLMRKWYGRWYDRGQGEVDSGQFDTLQKMKALCGALLFCRQTSLQSLQGPLFDPDFFLYKEDIELGLRLRKHGWTLLYHPEMTAYHCRGWQNERKKMAYPLRKMAARNEILLYRKHPSPYMGWAVLKYLLVTLFRL